jgi:hypothetical protein
MDNLSDVRIIGSDPSDLHPAFSWKAVIAGSFISLFVFAILMSLGLAIGGVSLTDGVTLKNSGTFGGLWIIISVLISLFAGGYFTARISNFVSPWIGMAEGAVLAALFMGLVLWQAVGLAGFITRSAGSMIGGAVQAGAPVVQSAGNNMDIGVSNIIEDNMADVQFKTDAKTVMSGVASRMIRGNPDSAKAYLARNTNLTPAQIDAKVADLNTRLQAAANDARVAAAHAMQVSGWSLFAMLVLALIGAVFGGLFGSRVNRSVPVTESGLRTSRMKPSHA